MMTSSAFDILGPIMVGPSSSHTAGAVRIASVARSFSPAQPDSVTFTLYNSFARTYAGHGTDRALVAGMLGLTADDGRVREAFELAREAGLSWRIELGEDGVADHPNTVDILMETDGRAIKLRGESLGGARVRICRVNDVPLTLTGDYPTLFVAHLDRPGVLAALTSIVSASGANIATMRTFRRAKGGSAYSVFEIDGEIPEWLPANLGRADNVEGVTVVHIPGAAPSADNVEILHPFSTGAELLGVCARQGVPIWQAMRNRERELRPADNVDDLMGIVEDAMRHEVTTAIDSPERSLGGLLGGQARVVTEVSPWLKGQLLGTTLTQACAYAMAVIERSANMGVIVAAPTAGSAGVVPGAVIAAADAAGMGGEQVQAGLWTAAAVGALIAENASVSGAEGGCQAEVGTAAAMAAAGIAQMYGASPQTCLGAASITLANMLGLVCDPVRGLVEYPCQLRNASGAANAICAAQLALSGIGSPLPFDEVVDAMRRVGESLPSALRETAQGGLATAPSAQSACLACGGCA